MAKIACLKDSVLICSGDTVKVYSSSSSFSLNIESVKDTSTDANSSNDPKNKSTDNSSNIVCMKFSKDEKYFALCDNAKNCAVWDTATLPWSLVSCRSIAGLRTCVALHFTRGTKLLLGDKSGDVYEYDIQNRDSPPVLLLGHVSMLLDLTMSEDEKHIITCDRDEKIRVSCYPNAYNIKCFCMGHTEYVINIFFLPMMPDILVSGSGDGTVRFWVYKTGAEIAKICCRSFLLQTSANDNSSKTEQTNQTTDKCSMKGLRFSAKLGILATLFANSTLCLFQIDTKKNRITWKHVQSLQFDCEPWDVAFNDDGFLLVLLPCQEKCLEVFAYSADEKSFQRLAQSTSPVHDLSVKVLNDWDFLAPSLNIRNNYHLLFKQWYDNVKEYYDRKQEKNCKKQKKV